jgi:hypothetical protein
MATKNPNRGQRKREELPTPDDRMSKKEKEDFEQQVEDFEGPDRREIRGARKNPSHPPGVSSS